MAEAPAAEDPASARTAVLWAPNWARPIEPQLTDMPALLMPVLGKPWLIHQIEGLVTRGARQILLAGAARAPAIAKALGDGARWGVRIDQPEVGPGLWDRIGPERRLWLMDSRLVPGAADLTPYPRALAERLLGAMLAEPHDPADALASWGAYVEIDHPRTLARLPSMILEAREVEPGVILSRNVEIHPTARVHPPVFLGQDVRVGRNATVGPDAVIHNHCLIGHDTEVAASVILPHCYIGEDLAVRDMVVAPEGLYSFEAGTLVPITDAFLIGDLRRHQRGVLRSIRGLGTRIATRLASA